MWGLQGCGRSIKLYLSDPTETFPLAATFQIVSVAFPSLSSAKRFSRVASRLETIVTEIYGPRAHNSKVDVLRNTFRDNWLLS